MWCLQDSENYVAEQAGRSLELEGWIISKKQCVFRYNSAYHIWTLRDCDNTHRSNTSTNQTESQHLDGEVGMSSHSPPRRYFQLTIAHGYSPYIPTLKIFTSSAMFSEPYRGDINALFSVWLNTFVIHSVSWAVMGGYTPCRCKWKFFWLSLGNTFVYEYKYCYLDSLLLSFYLYFIYKFLTWAYSLSRFGLLARLTVPILGPPSSLRRKPGL